MFLPLTCRTCGCEEFFDGANEIEAVSLAREKGWTVGPTHRDPDYCPECAEVQRIAPTQEQLLEWSENSEVPEELRDQGES